MPVTAPAPQASSSSAETTLDVFLSLNTPETFRTELIDGEIVVTPPAVGKHEVNLSEITEQFFTALPGKLHCSWNKGIKVGDHRCIPDLTIGLRDSFVNDPDWSPPHGVLMTVEITSPSSRGRDHGKKRRTYAEAQIPLYLLVDRERREVLLFSEPEKGDYRVTRQTEYGEKLPLPAPFDFDLDTSQLRLHEPPRGQRRARSAAPMMPAFGPMRGPSARRRPRPDHTTRAVRPGHGRLPLIVCHVSDNHGPSPVLSRHGHSG